MIYLMQKTRNIGQIIIQVMYIIDIGTMDIFVIITLFFSVISLCIVIFDKMKSIVANSNRHRNYEKKTYKMEINCAQLQLYHKYTHKLIAQSVCTSLIANQDNHNDDSGIEVFNVSMNSIESSIIALMDVTVNNNASAVSNDVFSMISLMGTQGTAINEGLKQKLIKSFGLASGTSITVCIEATYVDDSINTGKRPSSVFPQTKPVIVHDTSDATDAVQQQIVAVRE